jgi:pimeloyl-ACP methyl ester carboxylesterase
MPTVRSNGIDIYYEEHGSGEPLLLIMGWGCNAATWKPQVPGLAERFRVITFDNRGVGRTSAPKPAYLIADMVDDTRGLLDALDIERAHVFGISMGGMIAQELAINFPERIDALALGCTSPGSRRAAGHRELLKNISEFNARVGSDGPSLEWFQDFLKRLWTDGAISRSHTHLQDFVLSMIRFPPTQHGLRNQSHAVAMHDTYDRLSQIQHRTLVMTGDKDGLIDCENSLILAGRIPNADLKIFPGLKHAFHLEAAARVNTVLIDFIDSVKMERGDVTLEPAGAVKVER